PGERLYAVLDAAQDKDLVAEAKRRFGAEVRTLFRGQAAEDLKEVAPYAFPVDPASDFLDLWAEKWGKNVGILLTSAADPARLHRHLRDIFRAKDEAGQEYYFRYYDPRVLRAFL